MIGEPLYVACLVLKGRRCLVIGEGPMADEKVGGLQACGAAVELLAPGRYEPSSLEGMFLVVCCERELGRRVFADAERRAMLCNVVDVPELCSFILPAIQRAGPLTVAISTAGASPALAKRMKRELPFDDAYARLAVILDELRPWAKENLGSYEERRDFFESIVNGEPDPIGLLREGDEDAVWALVERAKP